MPVARTVGIVTGIVGTLSLAAGAITGGIAMDAKSRAESAGCTKVSCPTDDARADNERAFDFAHASTALVITGAALLATGIVLYVTSAPRSPRLSVRGSWLFAEGSF